MIARFSSRPDDYIASHLGQLNAFSDVFLLAAFRLHLGAQGHQPEHVPAVHAREALKS